jgi:hypothetical protein
MVNAAYDYYTEGEMAEWSNAAVSKTVVLLSRDRGFESPSLRNDKLLPQLAAGFLFYSQPNHASMCEDGWKIKIQDE